MNQTVKSASQNTHMSECMLNPLWISTSATGVIRPLGYMSLVLVLLFVAACSYSGVDSAAKQDATLGRVTGTVAYRERIALPHDAVVEVQLLDVSRVDAAATLIAEQMITPQHQVPIAFELYYDPAVIDERMRYAVRATIRHGDKEMFITNRSYPALTHGYPSHLDLVLIRSGG